jgi:hypothetical protein
VTGYSARKTHRRGGAHCGPHRVLLKHPHIYNQLAADSGAWAFKTCTAGGFTLLAFAAGRRRVLSSYTRANDLLGSDGPGTTPWRHFGCGRFSCSVSIRTKETCSIHNSALPLRWPAY